MNNLVALAQTVVRNGCATLGRQELYPGENYRRTRAGLVIRNGKRSRGQQLDEIMRDMDAASVAWVAAGYPFDGPEWNAREAVFDRLREWNAQR